MSKNGTILIVDDMAVNVKVLSVRLGGEGFDVLKAYNGEQAIKIAREENPDLILLDIMMPGMDGYEVTKTLKADSATAIIPIVLITALKGVDDKVKGLDAGADDFISKPPNQTELIARSRSLIKLKKLQEEAAFWSNKQPRPSKPRIKPVNKSHVMIIEDDLKTSELWKKVLSGDHEVVLSGSGEDAMMQLEEAVPDLILLDLLLPDIHGLDLLKRIRKNPFLDECSIIIVSCVDDMETRVKALDLGCDDYLVKPVNAMELLARTKAAVRKSDARKSLKDTLDEVFQLSITDHLTGLYNRQYFNDYIERYMAYSKRHSRKFSLMFIDIDRFKEVNDTFGHVVGDDIIREAADAFRACVRASDVVARYGGEEFVIVLSDTGIDGAYALAEKLRGDIEAHSFKGVDGRKVTVSIGVSEMVSSDEETHDLIRRADDALYKAKRSGRNCVVEMAGV